MQPHIWKQVNPGLHIWQAVACLFNQTASLFSVFLKLFHHNFYGKWMIWAIANFFCGRPLQILHRGGRSLFPSPSKRLLWSHKQSLSRSPPISSFRPPTLLIQDALQVSGIFEMWYLRLLGGSLLLSDVLQLFLIANGGRICGCRARDEWRSLPWLCKYWLDSLCLTRDNSTPLFQFSRPSSAIFQFVRQGLWRTH